MGRLRRRHSCSRRSADEGLIRVVVCLSFAPPRREAAALFHTYLEETELHRLNNGARCWWQWGGAVSGFNVQVDDAYTLFIVPFLSRFSSFGLSWGRLRALCAFRKRAQLLRTSLGGRRCLSPRVFVLVLLSLACFGFIQWHAERTRNCGGYRARSEASLRRRMH